MQELHSVVVPEGAMPAIVAEALGLPEEEHWLLSRDDWRVIYPTLKIVAECAYNESRVFVFDNSADAVEFKLKFGDMIQAAKDTDKQRVAGVTAFAGNGALWHTVSARPPTP